MFNDAIEKKKKFDLSRDELENKKRIYEDLKSKSQIIQQNNNQNNQSEQTEAHSKEL